MLEENFIDIIRKVDETYKKIKSIRPLNESEIGYFNEEFSISASHNSNAIEGNTFTYDETRLLLKEGITFSAHSFREHEDIVGYKKAFDYLYKALKENQPITEEFIKKLHAYVLQGDPEAGQYRKIQNFVGDIFRVKYTPCAPSVVPAEMEKYVQELQKDMSATKADGYDYDWNNIFHTLAKHHIEFEKIHPFVDGNGRTGRLLLTYEMLFIGLLPIDIRYEEKSHYYAALSEYDQKEKFDSRPDSKTEKMAKLFACSELNSMNTWVNVFGNPIV